MNHKKFKDACDGCGKMDYCKGYNGRVLCPECIKKEEENNNGNRKSKDND